MNSADFQSIKDALLNLLENPLYFRQIEKNAQEFGAKLKWKEVGRDYAQLFDEVINKKAASSSGGINLIPQVNQR